MSTKDHYQSRANILLIATGLVFLAVLSLQSQDIPVRYDATSTPDAGSASEELRGNSNITSSAPPVPPAMQKGFLR
ncbi:MAG: hypothetical protein ABJM26_00945 [Anderseniella sp.]